MQRKVFLGISPQKYQKKAGRNSTRYISTLRRENLSLTGCSSAEPVSVSVQHCKSQIILLYLQLVKKDSHLPQCPLFFMNLATLPYPIKRRRTRTN